MKLTFVAYTIRAAGGKGIGDSTLGGQSFFGTITKGLCNNMNGKKQDCTMLAGRVGVMWADGRQADPSNGETTQRRMQC
jgi:hypothetical protein